MRRLRQYKQVASLSIQEAMIYRWNMFLQGFVGLVPLFITIMVWRAIYIARTSAEPIGGFDKLQMTSYFIYVMIVRQFISTFYVDFDVALNIRQGYLSKFLIKPIDYLWFRWIYHIANRLVFCLFVLVPMVAGIALLHNYFVTPSDWRHVVAVVLLLIPIALINYLISFCIGMIAFWLLEVSSLFWIFYSARFILSGALFPLTLLPHPLATAVGLLPFKLTAHYPASLLLGQLSGREILEGLLLAAAWVVLLTGLAKYLWRCGLKRYDAAGI